MKRFNWFARGCIAAEPVLYPGGRMCGTQKATAKKQGEL